MHSFVIWSFDSTLYLGCFQLWAIVIMLYQRFGASLQVSKLLISKAYTWKWNCWIITCTSSALLDNAILFSKVVMLIPIPTSLWWVTSLLYVFYQYLGLSYFYNFFVNLMYIVVFHCGFNVPFPWNMRLSYVSLLFDYLYFLSSFKVHVKILFSFFFWVVCLYLIDL